MTRDKSKQYEAEIIRADWRRDLGRDDATFGLQVVFHSKDEGWDSLLEFYGEEHGRAFMVKLGAKKTQDLVGKSILVREDESGYFHYICPFPIPDISSSSGYSYETCQDGYVIFDSLEKRVEPWHLVEVLDKVLELSGVI